MLFLVVSVWSSSGQAEGTSVASLLVLSCRVKTNKNLSLFAVLLFAFLAPLALSLALPWHVNGNVTLSLLVFLQFAFWVPVL